MEGRIENGRSQPIRIAWLRLVILVVIIGTTIPLRPLPLFSIAQAQSQTGICGGVFSAVADTLIDQSQPTSTFDNMPQLAVVRGSGGEQQSLLSFDLKGSVPPGATIHSAELELALVKVGQPRPYQLRVFGLMSPWDEDGTSWNTRPTLTESYGTTESSQTSGTLRLDMRALVIGWLSDTSRPHSLALLPNSAADVQFYSREGQIAPRLIIRCAPDKQPQPVDQTAADQKQIAAIARLRQNSRTPLQLQLEAGAIRFATLSIPTPQEVRDSLNRARWFLDEYRDAFRLATPRDELQLVGRSKDQQHLVFRQRHNGIPVFPAELAIHLDGSNIVGVSGRYLPEISFDPTPRLSASEAETLALGDTPDAHISGDTQLRYINRALLGDSDPVTRLAWHITLSGSGTQRGLFIDANSGAVLYEQTGVMEGYDLELKTRRGAGPVDWTCWAPGAELWFNEGGAVTGGIPTEGFTAFNNITAVYNYWNRSLGRDSYDGGGRKIEMHLNVNLGGNANYAWWCDYLQFDTGWATRDILGHEFAHGIVHHTVDLEYRNQSGALNESFADIFGYFVDADDWLMGEDKPGGAIRDLSDPPAFGNPDHVQRDRSGDGIGLRMLSPGESAECDMNNPRYNDCGFVHTNSGIHNKAAYLIIRGDTFGGLTVRGLGQAKAERLFYNILQNRRLTASAQLIDARNAAIAEAASLVSSRTLGFTANDLCQVRNAYAAVGLGDSDRDCDGTEDSSDSDRDGDAVPNSRDNCGDASNPGQSDLDRDGRGDACDSDIDNDGLLNGGDNCPLVGNGSQADRNGNGRGDVCDDPEGDGVVDARDNCRDVRNSDQRDIDFDGRGDACDIDFDGDGLANTVDNSPDNYNPGQEDGDGDGLGDASDRCPGISSPDNGDADRDGRANPCDDDDDNDGVLDSSDNCRDVPNPDQWDQDSNGVGFACDENEQELLQRTARDVNILAQLRESQILRFPIPVCLSCPFDVLPANFQMGLDLLLPSGFIARVVDSNGIAVTNTIGGTGAVQHLQFMPAPHAATLPALPLGAGAADDPTASADTPAADQIRYRLEIIPTDNADLSKAYEFKAAFEEGRRGSVFLPLSAR